MKPKYRITNLVFLVFLLFNGATALGDEFNVADCEIMAIEPMFGLSETKYRMGGVCNGVHSFTLWVSWDYLYAQVSEYFESEQFGEGGLRADCPKDPVLFDGDCINVRLIRGVHKKDPRLFSRELLTQEQKAILKEELDGMVPPPTINSPVTGEFYGEQYQVGANQYRIPLQLTMPEPGINLEFTILALLSDDSGQVSMQEILTKKTTYNFFFLKEEEATYESSMLLPAGSYTLRATARTVFLHSVESSASFTIGDKAKRNEALSVKTLSRQIEIMPQRTATPATRLDKASLSRMQGNPGIEKAAATPTYGQFTVISPKPGVRYTSTPKLKVFLPNRDGVLYALIQCAGPDHRQPCDHKEGGIAAADLSCAQKDAQCSVEVPFGFEMPLGKAYSLYIRPDSSTDLVEVHFELGAMAEQMTPQAAASSPALARSEISRSKIPTGIVVMSIEQNTDVLLAGQAVDLKVWLKNMASTTSDAGLKYSVVCEVRSGQGACPFKDDVYTVDTQIAPGARYAAKLAGSVADAGIYDITVAAPLGEKGEPFTGNKVTKTVEVSANKVPMNRAAIKRQPVQNNRP